ncbi:hypothetical protein BJ875DRAFT_81808 [Amylocarpus encephaloides]|uniref:Uncharacterized protein n=1 Tax=Amylocarpus encephaloides TaxID=45428 RepID=A0A9P7YEU0_9HELO|nr:hypothetical protein BJ875DRAFT_81808 [Amylocarpus encephaloides]
MAFPPRPAWVNGNSLTGNVFDIIADFLSNDRKASRSASELTSLFLPYTSTIKETENVQCLWGTIFWLASNFHPGATEHWLLTELVQEIQKIPAPPGNGVKQDQEQTGQEWWTDLPGWRSAWADFECDAPLVPRMMSREGAEQTKSTLFTPGPWRSGDGNPMSGQAWANLNAFAAKLHARTDLDFLDLAGLYALLEALEQEISSKDLDNVVPAAACWILSAGKEIRENDEEHDVDENGPVETKRLPGSRGGLYKGPKGFSDERWAFWKSRFAELSKRADLNQNTRLFATQALDEMTCIEVRN